MEHTVRTVAEQLGVVGVIERAISFHTELPGTRPSLWDIPIRYNGQMQTAAGYCHYEPEMWISLHPVLTGQRTTRLDHVETLLHELAHAMSWIVYGPRGRGHGAHWWEMMHQLGQKPRRTHAIAACKPATDKATLSLDDMGL